MPSNGADPQNQPGWHVQNKAVSPYTQSPAGQLPATTGGNGTPGAPYPPTGSSVTNILANNGYAQSGNVHGNVATVSPIPSSTTAFANPFGNSALLTVTGGTVSAIAWAPLGSGTYTTVEAGNTFAVTVPGQASCKVTYSVVPTSITFTVL